MIDQIDEVPPPLEPNGKPEPPKVSDLVAVQNFLAGLIAQAEQRTTGSLERYISEHRQVHADHDKDVAPYLDYVDKAVQKDLDWDARLRPPARLIRFLARNWRTIAPAVIALLVALGVIRGDLSIGI